MMSQYVPPASPVAKLCEESAPDSLLMPIQPSEPRLNAITLEPSDHQLPIESPRVALWKPTMLAMPRLRCWHSQPLPQTTAVTVPLLLAGGESSELLKSNELITLGVP